MKFWSLVILLCMYTAPVFALTMEEMTDEKTFTIEDYIKDYVDIPEGGIDWKVFGTTKEISIEDKTEDGFDIVYTKPEFSKDILNLDGAHIKIKGYMFPLDEREEQSLFLFGPFPLTCPFQYHVGPSLVMEVHADENPIKFDYDAVTLTGTLELVPDDPDYSVFYRLKNVRQIK